MVNFLTCWKCGVLIQDKNDADKCTSCEIVCCKNQCKKELSEEQKEGNQILEMLKQTQ